MPDFDGANPPKKVTDPKPGPARQHLYRFAFEPGDTTVVVAWKAKQPIHNDVLAVTTDDEKAASLAAGYSDAPVLDAPKAKK